MTKTLLTFLFLGMFAYADNVTGGLEAYNNGEKLKALEIWNKACDNGDAKACFSAGFIYLNGNGVTQDKVLAKKLFKKACDGGSASGCQGYNILP